MTSKIVKHEVASQMWLYVKVSVAQPGPERAPTTGLAIVPVIVRAKGNEKVVQTYAFLDPGSSNTTFCTDKLIDRFGASGGEVTLFLTTMDNDNVNEESGDEFRSLLSTGA